jgi:hypothetical protein
MGREGARNMRSGNDLTIQPDQNWREFALTKAQFMLLFD